jgi:UDP-4-amino-4-deoxy-L-arabinose formyltransferase/UDP-glucuronic acid dehydrogenase (UDP-4-keto-hexauronic acid decarboxylating)
LRFTLFRPFNWIGPKLDDLAMEPEKEGSSRVVTQFISNMMRGEPIRLVDGGEQKRCFTYVDDGIDCLMRIIENKNDVCNGQIFNIGNPRNEATVRELARMLRDLYVSYTKDESAKPPEIIEVSSKEFYGKGYQDINRRVPSIAKAGEILGWEPKVDLFTALKKTIEYYLVPA